MQVVSTPLAAQTEIELWLGGEPETVHVFTELADAYMAEHPDVTITSTIVAAMQRLQDMAENGYLGPTPIARGYPEVMDSFWPGDILMTFTGPRVIGDAIANLGDEIAAFGAFHLPPFEADHAIYPELCSKHTLALLMGTY